MANKVYVRLIGAESCDHCNINNGKILYEFKIREVTGVSVIWLHKECLANLTEKLWMMEARQKQQTVTK